MLRRPRLVIVVCAAILAVQLLIPLHQLGQPRPARWGWQMYSTIRPRSTFTVLLADGSAYAVDPRDYVPHIRTEIDLDPLLPAYLCRTVPGIVAVRITPLDGPAEVTPCGTD